MLSLCGWGCARCPEEFQEGPEGPSLKLNTMVSRISCQYLKPREKVLPWSHFWGRGRPHTALALASGAVPTPLLTISLPGASSLPAACGAAKDDQDRTEQVPTAPFPTTSLGSARSGFLCFVGRSYPIRASWSPALLAQIPTGFRLLFACHG